ncbi:hypothetical protein [Virgibacillus halodenitrificans]|uniref:Uncharacterized protein n=1 Tax=Virgibacillus halodenitrificans TaxID=1482 RepID=A0ABR7VS61_VIRHA|nr:hypothetical protein [Virgibacillus halodenitrificans]MBD1224725.1 hypothetical protein [Virgibacillus halodenitrificans]
MLLFAETLRTISLVILIISSSFYLRHLTKTKKQRKLSLSELFWFILIQVAFLLFAISLLLFVFM